MNSAVPLVSVVTPVYNGEEFLAECIESVLAQTYRNWEYIIVNNCSQDKTLDLAQSYAEKDNRINVMNNHHFVSSIENHNIALRLISRESKYCKVVSADDWITPECLIKLVSIAEAHQAIGIVGSYQLRDNNVIWKGLPHNIEFIPGREVCRRTLLDNLDVFGNPTSSLYRSDLIRNNDPFFPHLLPHADTSACFKYLQHCDFGFAHEILSMSRTHDHQVSSRVSKLGMSNIASIEHILKYGPFYLTDEEFRVLKHKSLERYYRMLGRCLIKLKNREFWKYHVSGMKDIGCPISWRKVIGGALSEIVDELHHPRVAFQKVLSDLKKRHPDFL